MANLASLVAAEYAFAGSSPQLGTRGAFLAYLAEDAILFRPRPVRGRAWMRSQPARPGLLTWYPSFADLSRAGDLGCTTGPWEFRPNGPDDAPIAYGFFVSLWRVQANHEWKVELDCGIGCPPPNAPIEPLRPETVIEPYTDETLSHDLDQIHASLLTVERALTAEAAQVGVVAAFDQHSADGARVYRPDERPYVGRAAIKASLPVRGGTHAWQPIEARASRSGDLGYVYGLAQFSPDGGGALIESCYLRIWKQIDGVWRVLIDVDSPIPG